MLVRRVACFVRNLKEIPAEEWVLPPSDAPKKFKQSDIKDLNIKNWKDYKREHSRRNEEEAIQPVSPVAGPIVVKHPKAHDKIYRWCSCGQSLKQPFCDGSHQGTHFKPYKFTVEERVKDIKLCGCKLTTKRPFCDGKACLTLNSVTTEAKEE